MVSVTADARSAKDSQTSSADGTGPMHLDDEGDARLNQGGLLQKMTHATLEMLVSTAIGHRGIEGAEGNWQCTPVSIETTQWQGLCRRHWRHWSPYVFQKKFKVLVHGRTWDNTLSGVEGHVPPGPHPYSY